MKSIFSILLLFFLSSSINAQIEVDKGISKKELKAFFEQNGSIEVLNIKYKGARRAIGTFDDPDSIFNMQSGLVLSSGSVKKIAQLNKSTHTSSRNFRKGYQTMKKITRAKPKDAAVIKITFIPKSEYISFNYVFGSEEYPEFVNSTFNDGFAFFLKSPGKPKINLATIPDSLSRISINTVNHQKNQCYYINNTKIYGKYKTVYADTTEFWKRGSLYQVITTYDVASAIIDDPKIPVEFDGFTKLLQATAPVTPGKKHQLIICISDAADRIFDSGVLIESGSFQTNDQKDFKYGALATDSNYYFRRDTTLIYSPEPEIVLVPDKPFIDTNLIVHHPLNKTKILNLESFALTHFLRSLPSDSQYELSISSFTDEVGSTISNQSLSEGRAEYVKKLIDRLELSNVTIKSADGKGESEKLQLPHKEQRISIIHIEVRD